MPVTATYGLLAEFASADALIAAAGRSTRPGYTRVEAFAPYPLPEAAEALGYRRSGVAFLVFVGGLVGGVGGASSCSTGSRAMALPAERRRAAAEQLADVHPDHVRADRADRRVRRRSSACSSSAGCRGSTIRCSPRRSSPAPPTDGFYLCVEATDPMFDPDGHPRHSWTACSPTGDRGGAAHEQRAPLLAAARRRSRPAASRRWPTSRATGRTSRAAFFPDGMSARPLPAGVGRPRVAARATTR